MFGVIYRKILLLSFLFATSLLFSNEVSLKIYDRDDNIHVEKVDSDLEEYEIIFKEVKTIEGLEKLCKLRVLRIEAMRFANEDYAFISKLENLEVLIMMMQPISNFQFLEKLTNLKALIFQGIEFNSPELNFSTLPKLEYIEITNNWLDILPYIKVNKKANIKQLNFAYNSLTKESIIKNNSLFQAVDSVIWVGNGNINKAYLKTFNTTYFYLKDLNKNIIKPYNKYIR